MRARRVSLTLVRGKTRPAFQLTGVHTIILDEVNGHWCRGTPSLVTDESVEAVAQLAIQVWTLG